MLRLSDLHASYGAAPVLQGISLAVEKGETVALLGPNGAGKSTLLAAITGTIRRRDGRIDFQGKNLVHEASHAIVAQGVALVPEGRLVFAPFTVEDNLRLGAVRLRGEARERFDYVYALFPRLRERRRQPAGTLSGGEQQMLAIGRALTLNPKLLLLDEPLEGLAPIIVEELIAALKRIVQDEGTCAIVVEQSPRKVLSLAGRAVVLDRGTIVHAATSDALRQDPAVLERHLGVSGGR